MAGDSAVNLVEVLRLDEGVGGDGSKFNRIVHRRREKAEAADAIYRNLGWAQVIEAERHQQLHSAGLLS